MRAGAALLAIALAGCGAEPPGESVDACVERATKLAAKVPQGSHPASIVFTYDVTDLSPERSRALIGNGVDGSGPATMHSFSGNMRGVEADFIARKDTSRPAVLISDRVLYQVQRPVTGGLDDALQKGCALLAPEGRVVNIMMKL